MSSLDPMPSSAAVRLWSSLMVRRGARLGTAPGATRSASAPACSSKFVVCTQLVRLSTQRMAEYGILRYP